MADIQGVCELIEDVCSRGQGGHLINALLKLKKLRDEHVEHSNWNTRKTFHMV